MLSLSAEQISLLKDLYIQHDVPMDSFVSRRDVLLELVAEFNQLVNGTFDAAEIHHFMVNQRKRGLWPRIRRGYYGRDTKKAS